MIYFRAQSSELYDKLIVIAGGDLDLVQEAIRASALHGLVRSERAADLEDVVNYIVARTGKDRE